MLKIKPLIKFKRSCIIDEFFFNEFWNYKSADPDVIGLQEVTKEEYSMLRKQFERTYNIYGEFRGSFGVTNEACPIMIKNKI